MRENMKQKEIILYPPINNQESILKKN